MRRLRQIILGGAAAIAITIAGDGNALATGSGGPVGGGGCTWYYHSENQPNGWGVGWTQAATLHGEGCNAFRARINYPDGSHSSYDYAYPSQGEYIAVASAQQTITGADHAGQALSGSWYGLTS